MRDYYKEYKLDLNLQRHNRVVSITPTYKVQYVPKEVGASMRLTNEDSIAIYNGVPKEVILQDLKHFLAQKIADSLVFTPEDITENISAIDGSKTYSLTKSVVLPDEKLEYKAKENMLKSMVETAYRDIGKLEVKLYQQENVINQFKSDTNTLWKRLKLVFTGYNLEEVM